LGDEEMKEKCPGPFHCPFPDIDCDECELNDPSLMRTASDEVDVSASAPYDESGFKETVLTEEGVKNLIRIIEESEKK